MPLGFRFTPGQSSFLFSELQLPESFANLSFICNSLGLFYAPMHSEALASYSLRGAGLLNKSTCADYEVHKVLIKVVTKSEGYFGRFYVPVSLGVGCTVWYDKVKLQSGGGNLCCFGVIRRFLEYGLCPNFLALKKLTFLETCDFS